MTLLSSIRQPKSSDHRDGPNGFLAPLGLSPVSQTMRTPTATTKVTVEDPPHATTDNIGFTLPLPYYHLDPIHHDLAPFLVPPNQQDAIGESTEVTQDPVRDMSPAGGHGLVSSEESPSKSGSAESMRPGDATTGSLQIGNSLPSVPPPSLVSVSRPLPKRNPQGLYECAFENCAGKTRAFRRPSDWK
ncbi:hypothetical protein GP486_001142 [Trichoglossum hirsutum]|uniref:Uncharacterized protein n=1 Tax=Trichoglossum hirsutum TaxID=265104 RepID=A0A9P8LH80_9PEZI|nr:hypothetical protein GP486_001142 [Trichoglossum hirsutum]